MSGLFVPGWGAPRALYRSCLPEAWEVLEPPTFRATAGDLGAYRRWLLDEVGRRGGPVVLAGHSMGAALSVHVAAQRPAAIERLILIAPAGLPLSKPIWKSTLSLANQIVHGLYPLPELRRAAVRTFSAPRAALRLARTLRELDLTEELERVRAAGVRASVVGCATDALTTPAISRRVAEALAAEYRELDVRGGHVWMLHQPELLRAELLR